MKELNFESAYLVFCDFEVKFFFFQFEIVFFFSGYLKSLCDVCPSSLNSGLNKDVFWHLSYLFL